MIVLQRFYRSSNGSSITAWGEMFVGVVLPTKSTNIEPWLYRILLSGNDEGKIAVNCVRQEYIAYGKEEPNESKKQVKRWQLV